MGNLSDIDTAIEEALPGEEVNDETVDDNDTSTDDGEAEGSDKPEESEEEESEESTDDDEGEESEESEEKTDVTDDKGNKKPKSRYEKRVEEKQKIINELTTQQYALRAEVENLREQQDSKPPELPPKPDASKYTYHEGNEEEEAAAVAKYNQDVGKWEVQCEQIKKAHENRHNVRIQEDMAKYFQKMSGEKSVYGDYNQAYRNISENKLMNAEFHEALKSDPNNTDLFCFLGNRPDIARKVFSLKGHALSRELAKISVKLDMAKGKQKNKTSKAPKPPAKVKTGGGGGAGKKLEDMTDAEYRKVMGKAKAKLNRF